LEAKLEALSEENERLAITLRRLEGFESGEWLRTGNIINH
jgi:hypothetical protein